MNNQLKRTTFSMNRVSEYFSEKKLNMQIGHNRSAWKLAILKELIDNALDECKKQRIQPRINILIKESYFEGSDNGTGIPVSTITKSLDYSISVSDKQFYISPSRGQLGNAMKTI
ncbi:hypothetical protein B4O97_18675 [Marispirochaeta aestuarii]|uniref:Histidine kinase/HSP90-like ATPase domain-containing protein n=1 Tax=Marispirochaeta aestuarii TaxID=1963862 RepID=A0A1Y1RT01_9SPIO|nr:hypothetical protein [Marispirochaeta aestuarii]ORC29907.1 hypothetical protein B4O97_18675 [Marispirochaeta aestuarii]